MVDIAEKVASQGPLRKAPRRERNNLIRDLMTGLALCHNVTPIEHEDGSKDFQASSPDEIALVKFSEQIGIKLEYRDHSNITLQTGPDLKEKYQILAIFPFSSESKRMGIVLRNEETNRIIFYLKGAEIVMDQFVWGSAKTELNEASETLAMDGLRTLVITQRHLTETEFEEWNSVYTSAKSAMDRRDEQIEHAITLLEKNMELLGVTGVEDKLQENVESTVESLKQAGICIWMLTGDKMETAKCIAISSGLKHKSSERFFEINDIPDESDAIFNRLEELQNHPQSTILIIDGKSFEYVKRYHEKFFFQVAGKVYIYIYINASVLGSELLTCS